MHKPCLIAAQLSSVHSKPENLQPGRVARHLNAITHRIPLQILIVGWEEKPDLFRMLTSKGRRFSEEVFLWHPFLSDYPGFDPAHLVVNIANRTSTGWDGYQGTGIKETFKQACPNNPEAVGTSLRHLERLLTAYEFDGVFIDKIRFPSMANGPADLFSCFCPHCVKKAAETGLDLNEVKALLQDRGALKRGGTSPSVPPGAGWLEGLLAGRPLLQAFARFRADSINRVVTRISELVMRIGKKMSLDLFSPGLAPLVGQDFSFMGTRALWVKPMIYRFGNGPSSLRCEVPALIRELGAYLDLEEEWVMDWVGAHVDSLQGVSCAEIETAAPLSLILSETRKAVRLFPSTPVYLGLETVFIPGSMEIRPDQVKEILDIGLAAGVQGYVLSWDLLHTPVENVLPIQAFQRSLSRSDSFPI